jgi:hypothetical protein
VAQESAYVGRKSMIVLGLQSVARQSASVLLDHLLIWRKQSLERANQMAFEAIVLRKRVRLSQPLCNFCSSCHKPRRQRCLGFCRSPSPLLYPRIAAGCGNRVSQRGGAADWSGV